DLQKRLAPRADDESMRIVALPLRRDGARQLGRRLEATATGAVDPHEIGVAEAADRLLPVTLAPGPEITARESTKDRGPSGVRALALQRVEDLFHRVSHARNMRGRSARGQKPPVR